MASVDTLLPERLALCQNIGKHTRETSQTKTH